MTRSRASSRTRSRAAGSRWAVWLGTSCSSASTGSTNDVASAARGAGDREGRRRRSPTPRPPAADGSGPRVVFAAGQRPVRVGRADAAHALGSPSDTATTLVTLAAGVALAEAIESGHRSSRRSQMAQRSARRAPEAAEASWPEAGRTASAVDRASATASTSVRRRFRPSSPAARRRSNRSWAARSIARTCSPRRSRRSRGRYDDLLDGRFDAILDAWRAARRAPRGAACTWTTPAGTQQAASPAGIDDRGALLVRRRRPRRAHRRRRSDLA